MLESLLPFARLMTRQLGHHTSLAGAQTQHCWHVISRRSLAHQALRGMCPVRTCPWPSPSSVVRSWEAHGHLVVLTCADARLSRLRSAVDASERTIAAPAAVAAHDILPSHLQNQHRSPGAQPEAPSEQASTSEPFPSRRARRGGYLNRRAPPEESIDWQGPAPEQRVGSAESVEERSGSGSDLIASSRAAAGGEPLLGSGAIVTIRDQLTSHGIILRRYAPGQQNSLICPKCKGGGSSEASFSVHISEDSRDAQWICHRGTCGWAGGCSIDTGPTSTTGTSVIAQHPAGHAPAAAPTSRIRIVMGCMTAKWHMQAGRC